MSFIPSNSPCKNFKCYASSFILHINIINAICSVINTSRSVLIGGIRCVKNVTIHSGSILSINAGEHWLGVGAADNSMSLFHRPQERLGNLSGTGLKMGGWQLYRTPQKTAAMVCFPVFTRISSLTFPVYHNVLLFYPSTLYFALSQRAPFI